MKHRSLRSERIGSAFHTGCLRLIGCMATLVMASEAGAGVLFSPPTNFPAGDSPTSVAVADLDGTPSLTSTRPDFGPDFSQRRTQKGETS